MENLWNWSLFMRQSLCNLLYTFLLVLHILNRWRLSFYLFITHFWNIQMNKLNLCIFFQDDKKNDFTVHKKEFVTATFAYCTTLKAKVHRPVPELVIFANVFESLDGSSDEVSRKIINKVYFYISLVQDLFWNVLRHIHVRRTTF